MCRTALVTTPVTCAHLAMLISCAKLAVSKTPATICAPNNTIAMARPWHVSLVDRTVSTTSTTTGSSINNHEGATNDQTTSSAQPYISSNAIASFGNSNGEDTLRNPFQHNGTVALARGVESDESVFFLPALGELSIAATQAPMHQPTPPFAKLPGEIRNRIFRMYFDMFSKDTRENVIFRPTAAKYLNILQVNRLFRFEAGSIFDTEYLCVDNFVTVGFFQDALWLRLRSICTLVAIRNIHSRVSITCMMRTAPDRAPFSTGLLFALEQQNFDFTRIAHRQDFTSWLWQFICYGRGIERFSRFFQPARSRHRPFFPGKIDLGTETFLGQDCMLDCEEFRDQADDTVDTWICVSGSLAEIQWPKCDWRDLTSGQSYQSQFT